jgi:hypothetical protein
MMLVKTQSLLLRSEYWSWVHEKSVLTGGRYLNQSAYNSVIGSKVYLDLIALFSEASVLERPPNITAFVTTASYSRPEVLSLADPFILIATFDYATNTRDAALDGWSTVTSACQKTQQGTLVYAVAKDSRNGDRVGSVAAYESEKYFWEVHVPGQAVVDNKKKYGDIRTKTDLAYFKLIGGFLFNDKAYSRL